MFPPSFFSKSASWKKTYRSAIRHGFTLIELLVVIAIIAILAVVVVLTLNPAQLLAQSRDSNRLSDIATISSALGYLLTDQPGASLGFASTSYISIPDPTATTTAGDQCQGLGLPSLGSSTWQCGASSTFRNPNGTGWIPASLTAESFGSSLSQLPQDPINQTSSGLFYSYSTNGLQYEVNAVMESQKYKSQLAQNSQVPFYPEVAGTGSNLTLSPLWNQGSLIAYWPLDEGTGSVATDLSGNGNTGTWTGTQAGASGYYSGGKVGNYAGFYNGTNDWTSVGTNFPYLNITVSGWVSPASTLANGWHGFFYTETNTTSSGWWIGYNKPSGLSCGIGPNFSPRYDSSQTLTAGQWYFITLVIKGSTGGGTCYYNGSVFGTFSFATSTNGSNLEIGKGNLDDAGEYWNGLLDDVRVYNRALSAAEVQAIYNAQK